MQYSYIYNIELLFYRKEPEYFIQLLHEPAAKKAKVHPTTSTVIPPSPPRPPLASRTHATPPPPPPSRPSPIIRHRAIAAESHYHREYNFTKVKSTVTSKKYRVVYVFFLHWIIYRKQ